jgi:hypothetical protein
VSASDVWLLSQLFRLPVRDATRARALPILLRRIVPGGPRNDVPHPHDDAPIPRLYDDADDFGDGYGTSGLETRDWVPRLYAGEEDDAAEAATGVRAVS